MATVVKTFSFNGGTSIPYTAEGGSWQNTDGVATAGSIVSAANYTSDPGGGNGLQESCTGKNKTNAGNFWAWSGTWEDLGVTAGSTVTAVEVTYFWRCSTFTTGSTTGCFIGPFTLTDSGGTTQATGPAKSQFTTTTAYAQRDTGVLSVPSAVQPSNTLIQLRLGNDLATGSSNTAVVTLQQDFVQVTVTYTAPQPSAGASLDAVVTTAASGDATGQATQAVTVTATASGGATGQAAEAITVTTSAAGTVATGGGGSPALRGAKGFSTGAVASATASVTFPTTLAVGDLMLIYCAQESTTVTTWSCAAPVSGNAFTAVAETSGGATSGQCQLLYKTADSQDVTNAAAGTAYTVTESGSHLTSYVAAAYSNASGFDPTPTTSGQVNASSATLAVAGVTTTSNGDMLVWFGFVGAGSGGVPVTITPPTGFTAETLESDGSTSGTGTNVGMIMADLVQATAGATGAENGTLGGSHTNGGLLVSISGAGAGGAFTGTAAEAVTVTASATGSATGTATQAVAVTTAAAGTVAVTGAATLPVTVATSAAGSGTGSGSTPVTVTTTAAGSVSAAGTGSATLAVTVTPAAAGAVAVAGAAAEAVTVTTSAAGTVAVSGAATRPVTVTTSAAGAVAAAGQGTATLAATVGTTAAGIVAVTGTATEPVTVVTSAAGSVATASTGTRAVTVTTTATGTVAAPAYTGTASQAVSVALSASGTVATTGSALRPVTVGTLAAGNLAAAQAAVAAVTVTVTASGEAVVPATYATGKVLTGQAAGAAILPGLVPSGSATGTPLTLASAGGKG